MIHLAEVSAGGEPERHGKAQPELGSNLPGAALVGRQLLYWWQDDGWQRGTVARLCPRPAFSHVVAYTRQTLALRSTADSLLTSASYCARLVLLSPTAFAGVRCRPCPHP